MNTLQRCGIRGAKPKDVFELISAEVKPAGFHSFCNFLEIASFQKMEYLPAEFRLLHSKAIQF